MLASPLPPSCLAAAGEAGLPWYVLQPCKPSSDAFGFSSSIMANMASLHSCWALVPGYPPQPAPNGGRRYRLGLQDTRCARHACKTVCCLTSSCPLRRLEDCDRSQ